MPHEYTRQRQGRDFSLHDYLTNNTEANRKNIENMIKDNENNKSLHDSLERCKEETKRNSIPVDGQEPPEKGRN